MLHGRFRRAGNGRLSHTDKRYSKERQKFFKSTANKSSTWVSLLICITMIPFVVHYAGLVIFQLDGKMKYLRGTRMKVFARIGGILAIILMVFGQAQAALITQTYNFTATDWFNTPPEPPVDTLVGSATVTFDTDDDSLATYTTGITLNSLNVMLGSDAGFIYDPTGSLPGTGIETLIIGGVENGVAGTFYTHDFAVAIENPSSSTPSLSVALLTAVEPSAIWRSETGTVNVVPLPGTLALFGIAMVGLAFTRRGTMSK